MCGKTLVTGNLSNAFVLQTVTISIILTLSSAHRLVWCNTHSTEITILLSFHNIQITLCFTLSCSESWASPKGTWPWGGLLPQGAIAARVILVATAKSTTNLPHWGQVLWREAAPRHRWNRDHSGEGGQHILHAETRILVAKLVLCRRRGGRG